MNPQASPGYLRQPSLQGDTVVFVCEDDLWRASASGGGAHRLTAGLSEPATPCLSPDGLWIAYAGRDEQHSEVWLLPAAGGAARRLTWLGSELAVRGWTPDGRILFCSNYGQPFLRNWHAYTLGLTDGVADALPQRLPLGQINHLSFGPGGRRAIGRNTGDPARWKRYRGGTAGQLWVEDLHPPESHVPRGEGDAHFTRLSMLPGNISCPMWLAERLYFVGDGEGIGNLYSCHADGSDIQRHTDHSEFYVRHAACDGRRIVYQCGGELWLVDPAAGPSRRLEIAVPGARAQTARRHFVPAVEHLQGLQVHPAGHSVALEVRGQIHTMALWEGAVWQDGVPGARRRLGQWLADGQTRVAVSDAGGEERIETTGPLGRRELPWGLDALGHVSALRAAPKGTSLAIANHRNELWLGDVATESLQLADRSEHGRIEDPVWSPCGGWLAYTYPTSSRHTAIKLCEVLPDGLGRRLLATQAEFRDYGPAFDPTGRYLYFLSLRTFDPVYDSVQFELSFPRAARPYLIALQAEGPPPFDPPIRGMKADAARPPTDNPAPALPPLEPAGLTRRVAAFPVAEGRFGQIAGVIGGKVVWTALPIVGAHGRGGHKASPGRLEVFDFASAEVKTLVAQADSFVLAADHQTLIVRTATHLRAIDASLPPDDKPAPAEARPTRQNGLIDIGRLRVTVDPPMEWAQMLREVWRLQRNHFWVADMSGVDWAAMLARYMPLLPRVATRSELSDLIWELQGELGTSHAYEMGGDHRKPPAVALGHLGVALRATPAGWEITGTVQGDPWDAGADSPLNAVGIQAVAGERIVAVSGQAVTLTQPPQALLVHRAATRVVLALAGPDGRQREVQVTALADETPARYREWVERNRTWVHEASGGRVGYFHLPDMMSAGFAEFHRYFGTECDHDALIVDVRYNRGGHVSQLLLEKVARRRIAWNMQRWGQPTCYPDEAPAGPVVALTNEHAGSDGDIFSHGFKLMGIGKLVGQRTWGGVVGIWPRHKLIDGTETTQPEYSFWFSDVGWGVENHGTDPQIEVANAPHDDAFNAPERDRQLGVALDEALQAIDRSGVIRPAFGPRPRLAAPPLPERQR
jgi:tricorn protease